jgi:hypothetical protein
MKRRVAVLEQSARTTDVTSERTEREQRAGRRWLPGIMPLCSTAMLGISGVRFGVMGLGFHWI